MNEFIKGLDLSESFFNECALPLLQKHYPDLRYSAGLIGWGSDVLGYDDAVSTDHQWGPRFYLFLRDEDEAKKQELHDIFSKNFPYEHNGYSVNFSAVDEADGGVRYMEPISEGKVSSLIDILTVDEYLAGWYLGISDLRNLTDLDWLTFSEHRLLGVTSGRIYKDDLRLRDKLEVLQFYPENVRLYLIASNWSIIAEEQAFVRRCADVGDSIGSALVCGRIADRLMRLVFLYCKKYAPYSKWFGKAFSELAVSAELKDALLNAVTASDIETRENEIVRAQLLTVDLHNKAGITELISAEVTDYYEREIKVLFVDKIASAVKEKLKGTGMENYPLIGSFSGVANLTALWDSQREMQKAKTIY